MPRYFFHVQDGRDMPDDEGTVLADGAAARVMAVTTAGELIRDHARAFWTHGDWQMQVVDEQGATVCELRFAGLASAA